MSLSKIGASSRSAASFTWCILRPDVDVGSPGAGTSVGSVESKAGSGGTGGVANSGMLSSGALVGSGGVGSVGGGVGSVGAIGSGAGGSISACGSGNGPTGSPSSPASPSGTEEGAATGSEKTGSTFVVFVMSSIAFCKSLSIVWSWYICPPFIKLMFILAQNV